MKISTYNEFISTIELGPSVCVFVLDNEKLKEEWRIVFNATAEKYNSSMFLRFCVITKPLSEDKYFLTTINDVSCLIVNNTTNPAINSTLCNDLDSLPFFVCASNIFNQSEQIISTQQTTDHSPSIT